MLDTNFSFTEDTPKFWEGFWDRKEGLGAGKNDPDSKSPMLKKFHKWLWSKRLPNGQTMRLVEEGRYHYLKWEDMGFGSDSITTGFRYYRNRTLLDEVAKAVPDYKAFVEDYVRRTYTIGGAVIYPEGRSNFNTSRGCNPRIKDRWDLSLECIRRHYAGEDSPLSAMMERDRAFYDLFVDFKGYVDFFFFQDCVDENYNVKFWLDTPLFETNPIPADVDSYMQWINSQLDFVEKRNNRIKEYLSKTNYKDEFTQKMHEEFTVSEETEISHKAGCVWSLVFHDNITDVEKIENLCACYGITYADAMKYKEKWMKLMSK